jgi:hypothetical protein
VNGILFAGRPVNVPCRALPQLKDVPSKSRVVQEQPGDTSRVGVFVRFVQDIDRLRGLVV